MIDAAESAWRAELERLMTADIAELAEAFKLLARAVERGGEPITAKRERQIGGRRPLRPSSGRPEPGPKRYDRSGTSGGLH
jgi:hypothetical protein